MWERLLPGSWRRWTREHVIGDYVIIPRIIVAEWLWVTVCIMSKCRYAILITVAIMYMLLNFSLLFYQTSQVEKDEITCRCPDRPVTKHIPTLGLSVQNSSVTKLPTSMTPNSKPEHHLAVIVPFRNRWEELIEFVPHIHNFLIQQNVSHEIWIINQVDKHRFNRAMLLNVGYILTNETCDHLVMHDVDLLPLNKDLKYSYPADGPLHIASPELHPLYHYKKFVGGILMMTGEHFQKINGLTNIFWGWGREDDELYLRIKEAGLQIHRPVGITTGYHTFKHNHNKKERPRDMHSYGTQWQLSRQRDKVTGLSTLKFHLISQTNMTINKAPMKLVNIELNCDYNKTPFCDHPPS